MSDEYLWNRTGEPETDVEQLEKLLAPLAYRPKPTRNRWWRWIIPGAIAAGIAIVAFFVRPAAPTDWAVSISNSAPRPVKKGEVIETKGSATASLQSSFVGQLNLEPGSRLKLIDSNDDGQRFSLEHGVIHALIWAPPAKFVVNTPSAKAIDLGCQYTLRVERDGAGFLAVKTGWVAFQAGRLESFIPAGAVCRTRPKAGPGVPYFEDAPEELRTALTAFDDRGQELDVVINSARQRDALSLWHLMSRTSGMERDRVYARLSKLVKLPPEASLAAIERGDRAAFDAAWEALGLGGAEWWRTWKRDW